MIVNKLRTDRVAITSFIDGELRPLDWDFDDGFICIKHTEENTITFEQYDHFNEEVMQRVKLPREFFTEEVENELKGVPALYPLYPCMSVYEKMIYSRDIDFEELKSHKNIIELVNSDDLKVYVTVMLDEEEEKIVCFLITYGELVAQNVGVHLEDFPFIRGDIHTAKNDVV